MTKKNIALRAARRGWPVIPLNWAMNGRCSCNDLNCSSVGKHPITAHGVKDATTKRSTIRRWWHEFPKANIGVATGMVSNLTVLDVDPRHGGENSLRRFEKQNGPLPNGPAARTGSGGFHYYFKYSPEIVGNKIALMPGIDVKTDGGYVVHPGSRHKSGKRYVWLLGRSPKKVSTVPVPESLLRLTNPAKAPNKAPECEPMIPEGGRNSTLASLAGTMRSRGMTYEAIEAALLEDNSLRCDPPLPDFEVRNIARSISQYASGDVRILSSTSKDDDEKERKLHFRTGKQIAVEAPAKVPWLVRPFVVIGGITEVDGKVKLAGKTTFLTYMAAAVLDGSLFLGQQTSQTNVVYLTEQHLVSFRAAIERANLLGRSDFHVLNWTDTIGVKWKSIVQAAVTECKRQNAKLLIVDTLPQFAGLVGDKKNNSGDALEAMRPLQEAAKLGIAIVIARHERKSGGSAADSGRGSSAFAGIADIILSIRRQGENQPRNIRLIQKESRFDGPDELLVELTDEGYRALGAPGEVARQRAADDLLSAIPQSRKEAMTIEDLAASTGKKRAYLQRFLDHLEANRKILKRGRGRKGSPFRYFQNEIHSA